MKAISRREFLKGALAGSATIAATSALGLNVLAEEEAIYTPGTYSAQATGMGTVTVTMTFDEKSITDVILDVSEETPDIGQAAAEELRNALLSAQGPDIDGVSGATLTSTAVKKAAESCIAQAKGEVEIQVITKEDKEEAAAPAEAE